MPRERPLSSPVSSSFPTTRWTRVVAASDSKADADESKRALEELCGDYWYPIYSLIRRRCRLADEALDLTQAYFTRLLEKKTLAKADSREGRFRAFLRVDCEHFLADEYDRANAQKRGGGTSPISIDLVFAEDRFRAEAEPVVAETAEGLFDRAWATTLLAAAVEQVAGEERGAGRGALFEELHLVLIGDSRALAFVEIAARLRKTETAVRSAVARLRGRFREVVRERIAATLDEPDPSTVEDELRALFAALSR